MNPVFEKRLFLIRYIVVCTLFATAYAAAFGAAAGMGAEYALLDGAVFGLAAGFGGLMLWSVLRYGIDGIRTPLLRRVYYAAVGSMFIALVAGAETAAVAMASPEAFGMFAPTIPARMLCLVAVYALFALWYAYAGREDGRETDGGILQPLPLDGIRTMERITVRSGQKIEVIPIGDIIYLQAEGDYVYIVTSGGRWLKERTMKYFEENLPCRSFVRVHRSHIVSVAHISRIEQSGRERFAVLRDGTRLRISDSGYKLLRQTLSL